MGLHIKYCNSSIEEIEIKPCPFCGNTELYVTSEADYNELVKENGSATISIECMECRLDFYQHRIPNNNYYIGLGMLVSRWNTRIKEDE